MTPEQIRIAIAEVCGWTQVRLDNQEVVGCPPNEDSGTNLIIVPDYPNDLNAMHEAEKALPYPEAYAIRLLAVLHRDLLPVVNLNAISSIAISYHAAHATAAQRAEAFLRTIGKWIETSNLNYESQKLHI